MAKKVTGYIKLQIPAGKATPAPPVGPALGQHGVNIVQFTKEFNARTADQGDMIIPVVITVYADRSFSFITKTPPAAVLALNSFVNCTILTPCCPSAGPTGGAGVAFPAGICNLIYPVTFFAIIRHLLNHVVMSGFPSHSYICANGRSLHFLHFRKIQFYRCFTAEHFDVDR